MNWCAWLEWSHSPITHGLNTTTSSLQTWFSQRATHSLIESEFVKHVIEMRFSYVNSPRTTQIARYCIPCWTLFTSPALDVAGAAGVEGENSSHCKRASLHSPHSAQHCALQLTLFETSQTSNTFTWRRTFLTLTHLGTAPTHMRNGGAGCKLSVPVVPVKEASPGHQLNPDFIDTTPFLAPEQASPGTVLKSAYLLLPRPPEPPKPQPSAHTPFLTRPCCSGTQF